MRFYSTRDRSAQTTVGLSDAIVNGIAPDGGLYVPAVLPQFTPADFSGLTTLSDIAQRLLAPFAQDDLLAAHLNEICVEAFNFPAPLVPLNLPQPTSVLELFHGPTAAFKDFGARFLAASLQRIRQHATRKLTILVATSGDTGGAVAAAFYQRPWVDVGVLYPQGLVSQRQAQQLACWGENIHTFVVQGTFDDCQRMVKEAFQDTALRSERELSSANSINIGRLLPQMVYYATASLTVWRATHTKPNFIIPTGNLGNAMACVWARKMGLPIGEIVLATNANRPICDYLETGLWQPRTSVATLASAMDVGHPSNMERLMALYPGEQLAQHVSAYSVSDAEIRTRIQHDATTLQQVWCPHTATAAEVYRRIVQHRSPAHWIMVATAHPAKFDAIVEPLVGHAVAVPPALAKLLSLPRREREIAPTLAALRAALVATQL